MLMQDVRFALRTLRKNPGFTIAAVVTLALGIGANTAIFSLVNGVLLRPLPYLDDGDLVVLRQKAPKAGIDNLAFSVQEVYDYRDQNQSLGSLVEYHHMTFTLLGRGEPERVTTGVVSAEFFDLLGVKPIHGRTFRGSDDEPGAEAVLVLSHPLAQRGASMPAPAPASETFAGPRYEADGRLLRPVGYEQWAFAAAARRIGDRSGMNARAMQGARRGLDG